MRLPLLLLGLVALWLGVPVRPASAEPASGAPPGRIGRYELVPEDGGLLIHVPGDPRIGLGLVAGGGALAVLALLLRAGAGRGASTALVLIGLGVAAVGGAALTLNARWRVGPEGLVREPAFGRTAQWPRGELDAVEVSRRPRSAEEVKRGTGRRPWDVRVRGRDGDRLPGRFSFQEEREAHAFARVLADALGVQVRTR